MVGMTTEADNKNAVGLYRYYALGLMVLVYVVNFIDRSILSILNQSIKEDLGVSDTAMGFLGGIAFAVFYTFVGIPIARLADTGVRRNILAVCLAVWSGMTVLCGLVTNFGQLLAARIGVAVGEAGGSPPSHSMISDLFPPHQRATALGVYALGIPIGSMLGYLFGGWINEMFDWRTAFLAVGLPGIFLAIIVRLTLREPVRGASEPNVVEDAVAPPIRTVISFLWQLKSFRFVALGAGLHAFVFYGVGYWLPTMFFRTHGVGSMSMGQSLFLLGFAGIAGTFLGGYVTDKLGAKDYRWYAWSPALTTIVSVPFALFSFLSDDPTTALWIYAIPYFLLATYLGPTFSIIQTLVSNRMRATASSVLFLVIALIGLGLGPQFVGIASDVLSSNTSAGDDALRWALIATLVFNVICAVLYFFAASTVRDDLEMKKTLTAQ
jgi:MFS family permease